MFMQTWNSWSQECPLGSSRQEQQSLVPPESQETFSDLLSPGQINSFSHKAEHQVWQSYHFNVFNSGQVGVFCDTHTVIHTDGWNARHTHTHEHLAEAEAEAWSLWHKDSAVFKPGGKILSQAGGHTAAVPVLG